MQYIAVEQPCPFVSLIRLNRPKELNALSIPLLIEFAAALKEAEESEDIRCVVLTGDERSFSAGADIKEMPESGIPMWGQKDRLLSWQTLETFKKPLIAAVNGWALGGGFEAHSFPYTKNGEKRSLIARISLNEVLDLRDVLAGSVADACGLLDVVLRKKHRKQLTNRIHQLIGTDYVGEEVIEMVEATSQVGYRPARGLAPTAANKRVQKNEKTNNWEWRAFWSDQAPVVTPSYGVALDPSVEFKTTNVSDRYLLIPGQRDNIKMRKHGLEVKQLIESHRHYEAFRPKEVFKFPIEVGDLTRVFPRLYGGLDKVVNENELEAVLQTYGYAPSHVKVKKLRNRMRLADDVQLELCRFTLKRRTYWSACVEGPDLSCVRTCVHTINPQAGRVMGYMEFLDQVVREQ